MVTLMPALTVVDRQAHAGVHGAANNDIIQPQIPFSEGVAFASALVVEDTLWVFGTNDVEMNGGVPRTQVTVRPDARGSCGTSGHTHPVQPS